MGTQKYYLIGIFTLLFLILIYNISSFATNNVEVSILKQEKIPSKELYVKLLPKRLLDEFPPKANDLPLLFIEPIGYHGDEVPTYLDLKKWIGIFKDQKGYYLDSTSITVETCYDPIVEDIENDSLSWTGKYVQALHTDSCLYIISGLPVFSLDNTVYLKDVDDAAEYLYPPDIKNITFLGKKYSLYGKADVEPAEYSPDEFVYQHYQLFLRTIDDSGDTIKQVLAMARDFDSNMFRLLFVGDLDGDGFPDFIINTSEHYNVSQPTLYLSSLAQKGQLVGIAAIHRSVGC